MFISSNGFESRKHRFLPACCGILALACLLLAPPFVSCNNAIVASDPVVEREQKAFYEAWLRRELSGDELRKVTDEFIAYYTKKGKDRAGIHEATKPFLEYAKLLRERDSAPISLTLRHRLLEANYFDPDMRNTTELQLLTEPDPVSVVDPGGKRLMTEKEVEALASLISFSNSNGAPRLQEFSSQQIRRLTTELDRAFGNHPTARLMPRFYRETAALWAGILREWPNLSAEQKRQARAYAGKGIMAPMDDYKLYGKLLDLNLAGAFSHWSSDSAIAVAKLEIEASIIDNLWNAILTTR
jgi:hypothetical protein